jgi:hypothetical protein
LIIGTRVGQIKPDHGQETLLPEEFAKKYDWKNDPARMRLTAKGGHRRASSRQERAMAFTVQFSVRSGEEITL